MPYITTHSCQARESHQCQQLTSGPTQVAPVVPTVSFTPKNPWPHVESLVAFSYVSALLGLHTPLPLISVPLDRTHQLLQECLSVRVWVWALAMQFSAHVCASDAASLACISGALGPVPLVRDGPFGPWVKAEAASLHAPKLPLAL